jgi:hypothetical protein
VHDYWKDVKWLQFTDFKKGEKGHDMPEPPAEETPTN